jgi:quercetin dioxygenase-like cupin family protein
MAKSGDLLEMPEMGVRVRMVRTAADTGGEACEFEVTGRARGLLTQPHIHTTQSERLEPLSGSMKVVTGGREYVLNPGDAYTVPPGVAHAQVPVGTGEGTVRVTVTPAGGTEPFLEKLAELSREGRILKGGWPRPTAAAELVRDHAAAGGAAKPSPGVQKALAKAILASARAGRAARARVPPPHPRP